MLTYINYFSKLLACILSCIDIFIPAYVCVLYLSELDTQDCDIWQSNIKNILIMCEIGD